MSVTKITDWAGRLAGRLAQQYKGKPNLAAVVAAIAAQAQEVEDAFYDFFTLHGIDTATGATLDVVGRIVGLERAGDTDTNYRFRIRGAVRVLRSDGTSGAILSVFKALLAGATGWALSLTDNGTATLVLQVGSYAMSSALVEVSIDYLRRARAGGVRAIFRWSPTDDSHTFTLGDAAAYPEADALRGLGDSANPATGGQLAGARDA